jgi:hypothetical protein
MPPSAIEILRWFSALEALTMTLFPFPTYAELTIISRYNGHLDIFGKTSMALFATFGSMTPHLVATCGTCMLSWTDR